MFYRSRNSLLKKNESAQVAAFTLLNVIPTPITLFERLCMREKARARSGTYKMLNRILKHPSS